mgnify:CR=1 FL=1
MNATYETNFLLILTSFDSYFHEDIFLIISPLKWCTYHKLQTKVVCCCSMGAAWGDNCAKCPQKGTQAYKQMCGSGVPGMMVDPVTGVTHEIDECQMMPG